MAWLSGKGNGSARVVPGGEVVLSNCPGLKRYIEPVPSSFIFRSEV